MSDEFSDLSGKYGEGARCATCHERVHDEETGPNCEILILKNEVARLEREKEAVVGEIYSQPNNPQLRAYIDEKVMARCAEVERVNKQMGDCLSARDVEIKALTEKLANSVPRSRYEVCCDQYNEVEAKRTELFEKCAELAAALEIAQCMCSVCAPGETFLTGVDCKHEVLDALKDHAPLLARAKAREAVILDARKAADLHGTGPDSCQMCRLAKSLAALDAVEKEEAK